MKLLIFKPLSALIPISIFLAVYADKNLFLDFSVSSVIFLFAYCVTINFLFILKKSRGYEAALINIPLLYPGKYSDCEIEISGLKDNIPGFYYSISYSLYEKEKEIEKVKTALVHREGCFYKFETGYKRHGEYYLKNLNLIISDLFHFTEVSVKLSGTFKLSVFTEFENSIPLRYVYESGGALPVKSDITLNSTDFFDIRKYYPGDDLRKVNWKVFAHTNELHIREHEKIPPDAGKIKVLFSPYSLCSKEYELISGFFYKTMLEFDDCNVKTDIYHPSSAKPSVINGQSGKEIEAILNNSYKVFSDYTAVPDGSINLAYFSAESFLGFHDYKKIAAGGDIVVSFHSLIYKRSEILRRIYKIVEADSLIKEMLFVSKQNKIFRKKELLLKEKTADAGKLGLDILILRTDNEK